MRTRHAIAGLIALMSMLGATAALAQNPVYNWSGFYVGVQGGYGFGNADWQFVSTDLDGAFVGGQIGFNHQIGNLVLGIEADLAWGEIKADRTISLGGPGINNLDSFSAATEIDWLASIGLKMGLAVDRVLVYGKFGLAWAHGNYTGTFGNMTFAPPSAFSFALAGDDHLFGPMFGLGAEWAFSDRWSARFEYDYIAFGPRDVSLTGPFPVPTTQHIEQHLQLAKVGVNYRFGQAAPMPQILPMRPSGTDWSGFYGGVQAGYGFGRTDWSDAPGDFGHYVTDGWLGGAQLGANAQAGIFVAGVEAEWLWSGVRGGEALAVPGIAAADSSKVNWLATVTGRIGVAPWNGALLYGKAGAALAEISQEQRFDTPAGSQVIAGTHLNPGYVFGAGLEQMLYGNWSARVEYNHVSFLQRTQFLDGTSTLGGASVGFAPFEFRQSLQLVKLGLNYRFAPPPPPPP